MTVRTAYVEKCRGRKVCDEHECLEPATRTLIIALVGNAQTFMARTHLCDQHRPSLITELTQQEAHP